MDPASLLEVVTGHLASLQVESSSPQYAVAGLTSTLSALKVKDEPESSSTSSGSSVSSSESESDSDSDEEDVVDSDCERENVPIPEPLQLELNQLPFRQYLLKSEHTTMLGLGSGSADL